MITLVDNFFSDKELKLIRKEVNSSVDKPKWRSNMFWHKEIVKQSSAVVSLFLSKKINKIITNKFIKIKPEYKDYDYKCQFYMWYPFSYIPQHKDHRHKLASTIYLNYTWDINFGGLFELFIFFSSGLTLLYSSGNELIIDLNLFISP